MADLLISRLFLAQERYNKVKNSLRETHRSLGDPKIQALNQQAMQRVNSVARELATEIAGRKR